MYDSDLQEITDRLRAFLAKYEMTSDGRLELNGLDRATAKTVLREARTVLSKALGYANDFSTAIFGVINEASYGLINTPTHQQLQEGVAAAEGGLRQLRRESIRPNAPLGAATKLPYVAPSRIAELQVVQTTKWDMKRLVRMLQELNIADANDLHMATAMLLRAICDHIPPIFGTENFAGVANNVGGKSISGNLKHLNTSLRSIADGHLHAHIRQREELPSASQVNFRQDLDVLLQEVVRLLRQPAIS